MKTFIKTTVVLFILLIVACVIAVLGLTSCTTATASELADSIVIYNDYYKTTEKLLTEIDNDHDWSTFYADSGKEEDFGYYHVRYVLRDTRGMTIAETYKTLKAYYQETQDLLLVLEEDFNWLDTTGEGDTYIEWCKILKKIQR